MFDPSYDPAPEPPAAPRRAVPSIWGMGERATWISGLVLALSALTGWYAGSGEGVNVAVLGWHTGVLGKLVFFIGLAAILVVVLRQWGFDLPGRGAGEPARDRARRAGDDLRARASDLDPGGVLLRASRGRDLDQPRRIPGSDRRRASASFRRAIAIATPSAAPASTSKGIVHADVDPRERDQRREGVERHAEPWDRERQDGRAREADGGMPRGERVGRRQVDQRLGVGVRQRRTVAVEPLLQRRRDALRDEDRHRRPASTARAGSTRSPRSRRRSASQMNPKEPAYESPTKSGSSTPLRWSTTQLWRDWSSSVRSGAAAWSARSASWDRTACR